MGTIDDDNQSFNFRDGQEPKDIAKRAQKLVQAGQKDYAYLMDKKNVEKLMNTVYTLASNPHLGLQLAKNNPQVYDLLALMGDGGTAFLEEVREVTRLMDTTTGFQSGAKLGQKDQSIISLLGGN